MKDRRLRIAAVALATASLVPLASMVASCGGPVRDDEGAPGLESGLNPYPEIHGGAGSRTDAVSNFEYLINNHLEGKPKHAPWAAFWWPYTANGIASGSYGSGSGGQSPAGKYDAARGRTTNSQAWEVKNHGAGVPKVQGWWGHCNGWCASSALYEEPRESVKVNGVTFGVADLKGILAEAGMAASADFFGNRVDPWTREFNKAFDDTVADQYFLVLTNYMGKFKLPVLIDRFTGSEVWNQPLAGYRFKYPKKEDYKGCTGSGASQICKINVESTIWWYNDSGVRADIITPEFNFKDEIDPQSGAEIVQHRDLVMEVWLDGPVEWNADGTKITKSGNVVVTRDGDFFVGGAWLGGGNDGANGHPDYMWVPYSLFKTSEDDPDPYANPHIDIKWIEAHLLVPGGADDPSVRPSPIETAPSPRPSQSPSDRPSDRPTDRPTSIPTFNPRPTFSPGPAPTFTSGPRPTPTFSLPFPFPRPTSTSPGPRPTRPADEV